MSRNYDARHNVSEEYVVRPAWRPDPEPDVAWEMAGGVLAILFVGCVALLVAVQALRWMGVWK